MRGAGLLVLCVLAGGCLAGTPDGPAGPGPADPFDPWRAGEPEAVAWRPDAQDGATRLLVVAGRTGHGPTDCDWGPVYALDFANATLWLDPSLVDANLTAAAHVVASYVLDPSCPVAVRLASRSAFVPAIRDPCPSCTVEPNAVGLPSLVVDAATGDVGVAGTYLTDAPAPLARLAPFEQVGVTYRDGDRTTDLRIVLLDGWTVQAAPAGEAFRVWDQRMPWDPPATAA